MNNNISCVKCGNNYNSSLRCCMKCGTLNFDHPDNIKFKKLKNRYSTNNKYINILDNKNKNNKYFILLGIFVVISVIILIIYLNIRN